MPSDGRNRLALRGAVPVANPERSLAQVRRAGQAAEPLAHGVAAAGEYAFLAAIGIGSAAIAAAKVEGARVGAAAHEVLLSAGVVAPATYASALAAHLGVPCADWSARFDLELPEDADDAASLGLPAHVAGEPCRVLRADDGAPEAVKQRVAGLQARGAAVALACRPRMDAAVEAVCRAERMDHAVHGLLRQRPACSAAAPLRDWQIIAAAVAVGLVCGGLMVVPGAIIAALTGIAALPFLCVTVLRVAGLGEVIAGWQAGKRQAGVADLAGQQLPLYSVLVPLLRETRVLPGLVQALKALDYPKSRLEIFLVLEADDIEMQAAVMAMDLPGCFRTILVPDEPPRTKPKALNYALQFARGDYVVVYDAEDRPEGDQLLRALATFRRHPPTLGCVQAQLNIYNPRASWIARGIMAQTPLEVNPSPA